MRHDFFKRSNFAGRTLRGAFGQGRLLLLGLMLLPAGGAHAQQAGASGPATAQVAEAHGATLSAAHRGSFWFPEQASELAEQTDWLFNVIMGISVFFLALVTGMLGYFIVAYRRRPGHKAERTATHITSLELAWTIIPSLLCVFIYYLGLGGYLSLRTPVGDVNAVNVTGQKWNWLFNYPNGIVSPDLHIPNDMPSELTMRSEDVIHSLYIPAFRAKMDVVPGRYSKLFIKPRDPGQHQIFCAEYCGTSHSGMLAQAYVHTRSDYEKWLRDEEEKSLNQSPVALGQSLYKTRGCAQCHSVDGSHGIGPTFKGAWGRTEHLEGGGTVVVDENYIHESIVEPLAKVVLGYNPVMPTFKGKLKDKEIQGIIEYIKTLK